MEDHGIFIFSNCLLFVQVMELAVIPLLESALVQQAGQAQVVSFHAPLRHMGPAVTRPVDALMMPHVIHNGAPASVCLGGRECTVMSLALTGENSKTCRIIIY